MLSERDTQGANAVPVAVRQMIDNIIEVEGGYVNDPADRGGETKYGITIATARAYGYRGAMRDLPRVTAFDIYLNDYYLGPHFDWIAQRDARLAEELTDTGVNMGQTWGVRFLQRALNAFNDGAALYPDLAEDGFIGRKTLSALDAYLAHRGSQGRLVLLGLVDSLQAARYIDLTLARPSNERFAYGWIANRTLLPASAAAKGEGDGNS